MSTRLKGSDMIANRATDILKWESVFVLCLWGEQIQWIPYGDADGIMEANNVINITIYSSTTGIQTSAVLGLAF
jgi:hypothetical protein